MNANNQYLTLFANCIPVKGASRSVICDTQHKRVKFIPNSMYDWIQELKSISIEDYQKELNENQIQITNDYIDFIIQNDFGFFCTKEELAWFPEYDGSYESPNEIENAIIDSDDSSNHNYQKIFSQLEQLGCEAIQLRFFDAIKFEQLNKILSHLEQSSIVSIDLALPFSQEWSNEKVKDALNKHPRIFQLTLTSFPATLDPYPNEHRANLVCSSKVIDSNSHCGIIDPKYFRLMKESMIEARDFNNCLNKKISIDVHGTIKNCPTMSESFGNIASTTLEEALNSNGFKTKWFIKKDDIKICQDCEFRYICSDCRAYTQNEDAYGKPLKCNYNPEKMEWKS